MAGLKYFDVTDHGATGKGTVDDTNAIITTESKCEAKGGGVVYFPPGTYLVSRTMTIGLSGVQWRGTGAGSSTILSAPTTGGAPTVVQTTSGVSNVQFRDLAFLGNQSAGTTVAPPVLVFSGGQGHKLLDCFFKWNTGQTAQFLGVKNVEVTRCRFYQVGNPSNTNTGTAYRTDALVAAADSMNVNSIGVNIHHNHFDTCYFGAIYVAGMQCDVSHNFITNAAVTGIYFNNTNTLIAFNSIQSTTRLAGATTQCAGIQANSASDFSVMGNNVGGGAGDGIAITNGWAYGIVMGNNCLNNGQSGIVTVGDSGIKILSDQSGGIPVNQSLTVVGNTCSDNQQSGHQTQTYGIHIDTTNGSQAYNGVLAGNSTFGNTSTGHTGQGIYESHPVMADDSNTIIGNSDWLERLHTSAPMSMTTKGFTSPGPIASATINAGSMRQRCGIRITAAGTINGTSAPKVFQLGFQATQGASTNIFNFTTAIPISSPQPWQLIATITNNQNATTQQAVLAMFYLNNTLYKSFELTLTSQDTSATQYVTLSAMGASGSTTDYVQCDFLLAERC